MTTAQNLVALVVGLFAGAALNMALVLINLQLFDAPADLDFSDAASTAVWIGSLPPQAFLLPIAAHLVQAFGGGWIAARLGASRPLGLAMVVGVLSLAGGVINLMQLPAPWWMWLEVPMYLIVAWWAGALELRRREGLAHGA